MCQILSFSLFQEECCWRSLSVSETADIYLAFWLCLPFTLSQLWPVFTFLSHLPEASGRVSCPWIISKQTTSESNLTCQVRLAYDSSTIFFSKIHSHNPNHTLPREGNDRLIRTLFKPQISPRPIPNLVDKNVAPELTRVSYHTIPRKIMVSCLTRIGSQL